MFKNDFGRKRKIVKFMISKDFLEMIFDDILQIGYAFCFIKISSMVPIMVSVILMNGAITSIKLTQKIRTYRKKVRMVKKAMRVKLENKKSP